MQWAARRGVDVRVLSDCNSLFINHMLTGAKAGVREVITNFASFQRVEAPPAPEQDGEQTRASSGWSFFGRGKVTPAPPAAASHRLVVQPRHDVAAHGAHGCPLCPPNLCKVRITLHQPLSLPPAPSPKGGGAPH